MTAPIEFVEICVHVANYKHGVLGTLRKTARSYHTIARCAMRLRTKSEEVRLDATTRAKLQEPRHYIEFMNVLHNRRSAWEKGKGSTLANVARVETRSRYRSPQHAKENAEKDQYLGKRLTTEFKGEICFGKKMK